MKLKLNKVCGVQDNALNKKMIIQKIHSFKVRYVPQPGVERIGPVEQF